MKKKSLVKSNKKNQIKYLQRFIGFGILFL